MLHDDVVRPQRFRVGEHEKVPPKPGLSFQAGNLRRLGNQDRRSAFPNGQVVVDTGVDVRPSRLPVRCRRITGECERVFCHWYGPAPRGGSPPTVPLSQFDDHLPCPLAMIRNL